MLADLVRGLRINIRQLLCADENGDADTRSAAICASLAGKH
jgi:hypothetical protein